jgi:2-C-methyl-D-erythritol 4-phosphate cytidylyltransferase
MAGAPKTPSGAAPVRKPLLEVCGRTVLEHACAAFDSSPLVTSIVLVGHRDDLGRLRELVADRAGHPALAKVRAVVAGGKERTDSVRAGVQAALGEAVDVLCIHDAARPLISTAILERAIEVAAEQGSSLVAVPVRDTIKSSSSGAQSESTLERSLLWAAQTPQCFHPTRLRELLERAAADGWLPTDEAALHERYLGPVPIVEGNPENLKLTSEADLALVEAFLRARDLRAKETESRR